MGLEATAWAFSTPLAEDPFERLVLILLADATDQYGVCCTRLESVARDACMTEEVLQGTIYCLKARGVLAALRPAGRADPDFTEYDVLCLSGWDTAEPMKRRELDGVSLPDHPVYGRVIVG